MTVVVGLASGCGEPLETHGGLPPIVWEGEHLQVGTDLDMSGWCPGTLPYMDAVVATYKAMLEAPEDLKISYYMFDDVQTQCATGDACANGADVYASELLANDALVHAVSSGVGVLPHFFAEGLASYLGGGVDRKFFPEFLGAVLDAAWARQLSIAEQVLAAHVVSELVHTDGLPTFVQLMRATTLEDRRPAFEAIFADVYGRSLDAVVADYLDRNDSHGNSLTDCTSLQSITQWPHACAQAPYVVTEGVHVFDLDISCAGPDVVGPSGRWGRALPGQPPRIWRDIAIDSQGYGVELTWDTPAADPTSSVRIELHPCDTDCRRVAFHRKVYSPGDKGGQLDVPSGRYVMRVSRDADDPGPVQFSWRRAR